MVKVYEESSLTVNERFESRKSPQKCLCYGENKEFAIQIIETAILFSRFRSLLKKYIVTAGISH